MDSEPGMLYPYTVCASNGGPFDDAAYVAGWEMGVISIQLELCRQFRLGLPQFAIHRENLPQLDLVAMHNGVVVHLQPWPDHIDLQTANEWAHVTFTWSPGV